MADNIIKLKKSNTPGAIPQVSDLSYGELALNAADGIFFFRRAAINGDYIESVKCDSYAPYTWSELLSGITTSYGNNNILQPYSTILGGYQNVNDGPGSTIINGEYNNITGQLALIGGGSNNLITIDGDNSVILGGENNRIDHKNVFTLGSGLTSHASDFTYTNNISSNGIVYANNSNSNQWTDVFTTVNGLSSIWGNVGNNNFLPLTGGTITGSLSVLSSFEVGVGDTVLFVSGGKVGINTVLPNIELTVNGSVSTNNIIYDSIGNSTQWNSAYTNLVTNSANYLSGFDLSFLSVSANWNSVFTNVGSNSANWSSVFTTVCALSSEFATRGYVYSEYFSLTGGTVTGATKYTNDVTIFGKLSAIGGTYFANTVYTTTSALSVSHFGDGPALYVGQTGTGDIASFVDEDQNIEVLHIGGGDGGFPNVGVKTSTPNVDFTVKGQISASGDIWTSGNFISGGQEIFSVIYPAIDKGIIVYTNVNTNSANWDSVYTSVKDTSANWDSAYTNLVANSASYLSGFDLSFLSVSANWDSVYTNVNTNSATYATYAYVDTNLLNLTGGTIDGNLFVLSSFKVGSDSNVLFVSGGKVGINTELPTVELTVNGSISAYNKIYGTIIDWMTLTRGFKTEPTLNTTIAGGDVYNYVYESSPTDKTYYRYIATDGSEDAYYETFSGGNLSNLIAKKKIIV